MEVGLSAEASKLPRTQSDRASIHVQSMEAWPLNLFLPYTTADTLNRSELFCQQEMELHNIKQVALMLWPIGVNILDVFKALRWLQALYKPAVMGIEDEIIFP